MMRTMHNFCATALFLMHSIQHVGWPVASTYSAIVSQHAACAVKLHAGRQHTGKSCVFFRIFLENHTFVS